LIILEKLARVFFEQNFVNILLAMRVVNQDEQRK